MNILILIIMNVTATFNTISCIGTTLNNRLLFSRYGATDRMALIGHVGLKKMLDVIVVLGQRHRANSKQKTYVGVGTKTHFIHLFIQLFYFPTYKLV